MNPVIQRTLRQWTLGLFGLVIPLLFTQCQTQKQTYKSVKYDAATLKTPAGHGMQRKDYPFDNAGNYRKDWVRNNTTGRDSSAYGGGGSSTSVASTTVGSTGTSADQDYPTYAQASAARGDGSVTSGPAPTAPMIAQEISIPVTPSAVAASSSAKYHKVVKNDTLFSLSKRYGTSVSDIKRINGLSSDSIRVGQSLRIP